MKPLMTMLLSMVSLGLMAAPAAQSGAPVAGDYPGFTALIDESEMRLQLPEGYREKAVRPNEVFDYDRAVASPDGRLEIRYTVRPFKRLHIEYDDPHGSAPDPNHIFPLMFQSVATRLSGGGYTPTKEYPVEQARQLFNADWAAAGVFDVAPDYGSQYKQGLVLAMHRSTVADAYVVFLFDDYAAVKKELKQVLSSLAFLPRARQGKNVAARK